MKDLKKLLPYTFFIYICSSLNLLNSQDFRIRNSNPFVNNIATGNIDYMSDMNLMAVYTTVSNGSSYRLQFRSHELPNFTDQYSKNLFEVGKDYHAGKFKRKANKFYCTGFVVENGTSKPFLITIDESNGTILTSDEFNFPANNAFGFDVEVLSDGTAVIVGMTSSNLIDFGPSDDISGFILRFDPVSKTILWSKELQTNYNKGDFYGVIEVIPSMHGDMIAIGGGVTDIFYLPNPESPFNKQQSASLVLLDENGNFIWDSNLNAINNYRDLRHSATIKDILYRNETFLVLGSYSEYHVNFVAALDQSGNLVNSDFYTYSDPNVNEDLFNLQFINDQFDDFNWVSSGYSIERNRHIFVTGNAATFLNRRRISTNVINSFLLDFDPYSLTTIGASVGYAAAHYSSPKNLIIDKTSEGTHFYTLLLEEVDINAPDFIENFYRIQTNLVSNHLGNCIEDDFNPDPERLIEYREFVEVSDITVNSSIIELSVNDHSEDVNWLCGEVALEKKVGGPIDIGTTEFVKVCFYDLLGRLVYSETIIAHDGDSYESLVHKVRGNMATSNSILIAQVLDGSDASILWAGKIGHID